MNIKELPNCLCNGYSDDAIVYYCDNEFFYNKGVDKNIIEDLKNNEFQVYTGYYEPKIGKWEKYKARKSENKPTIYLIGRGKKSGKQKLKIEGFLPYCYMPDTEGDFETYLGDKVRKIIFDCNPRAVGDWRKTLEEKKANTIPLEADVPFIRRFLCDTYPSFKSEKQIPLKIAVFDIETNFPVSDDLISFSINDMTNIYHNSIHKVSREELVLDAYNKLKEFDIVTGWNISFDIDNLNKELKAIDKSLYINNEVGIIDMRPIVKKVYGREIKGPWSLDNTGDKIIGIKKVDIGCYPRELGADKLEEYNNKDVLIPQKLEEELGALMCHIILSWSAGCTIEDTEITTVVNDLSLLRVYHKAGKVLNSKPPWSMKPKDGEARYKAADPKAREGVYRNVMAFDVKHCYPWAVRAINATPETKDKNGKYTAPNGLRFNDNKSVFIDALEDIINERGKVKSKLKSKKKKDDEYKKLKFIDFALKTQAAAFSHGEFGYWRSRMKDYGVAEAITQTAHDLIFYSMDKSDELGYPWVYSHTDSIYIRAPKRDKDIIVETIDKIVKEYCKDKGYRVPAELEYQEPYIKKAYIHSPARNVMIPDKVDIDDVDNWMVTGMNFMRSETPDALKKIEIDLVKLKLKNKNTVDLLKYFKVAVNNLGDLDSRQLGIVKPINKPVREYGGQTEDGRKIPIPYHIQALLDAGDEYGFEVEEGEKFMVLPVISKEVTGKRKLKRVRKYMAFPILEGLPKEYEIDFENYLKSNLYGKIYKLFDIPEDILEECVRDYIPNIDKAIEIIKIAKEEIDD